LPDGSRATDPEVLIFSARPTMATTKHKAHTLREKPNRNGPVPAPRLAPLQEAPVESEQEADASSRFTFTVWLLGFGFLGSLVLWDFVTALLFR
jgi:hypothetical protein